MNANGPRQRARSAVPQRTAAIGSARALRATVHFFILVAASLFASNASAYRTGADLEKFKGTERVRWETSSATFDLAATLPPGINPFDFSREFVRAFGQWSAPDCGGFRAEFGEIASTPAKLGDGRNTIQMVSSGWTALGYADTAAGATDIRYSKAAGGEWRISEADIYINAEFFTWTTSAVPLTDEHTIFSVLLHEGGHALGLLHPCEEEGGGDAPQCKTHDITPNMSVMYPVYDASQSALTADDIAGNCFLYRKCESTGCPDGFECGADGCSLSCPSDQTTGRCSTDQVCSPTGCVLASECAATNCLQKDPCTADVDCAAGEFCTAEGACKTGDRAFGDACSSSPQCAQGVCLDGACVPACSADDQCASDAICDVSAGSQSGLDAGQSAQFSRRGACIGPQKPLGRSCSESNECLGGECLAGASREPVCTRLCGAGKPECPAPWTCTVAEGRSVCAPLGNARGGCAVVPRMGTAATPGGNGSALLAWLGTLGFCLRVRRRRAPHRDRVRSASKV
jgi:hypothetical protein